MQASSVGKPSVATVVRSIGFRGMYNGIGVALVGGMPATCLYLTSYEVTKDLLTTRGGLQESSFAVFLASGMLAEVVSCVLFVPVDVIKERLQVQTTTRTAATSTATTAYKGSWDALRTILRTEGASGLYRGFGITLLSFGPFSALYFSFYESLKGAYMKRAESLTRTQQALEQTQMEGQTEQMPFMVSLLMSATAGSAASVITNPLDLVKLRIQIERRALADGIRGSNMKSGFISGFNGVVDMVSRIWQTEGLRGLFRGAGARIAFHAPNTAITMALFETCKAWWNRVLT